MNYQTGEENGYTVLFVRGDLKTAEASGFEQRILEEVEENDKLILDLQDVGYICSAGLRALLAGQQKVDDLDDGDLIVRNVCREVLSVFKSTGFVNVLTIE
ncbi:MAG: STAS domain-containing protein [Lachnospiraceae bacterium]|nr:STAS domain-containing protein [Lachnospiraceae bacterium]